jgi:hypothetical protein
VIGANKYEARKEYMDKAAEAVECFKETFS